MADSATLVVKLEDSAEIQQGPPRPIPAPAPAAEMPKVPAGAPAGSGLTESEWKQLTKDFGTQLAKTIAESQIPSAPPAASPSGTILGQPLSPEQLKRLTDRELAQASGLAGPSPADVLAKMYDAAKPADVTPTPYIPTTPPPPPAFQSPEVAAARQQAKDEAAARAQMDEERRRKDEADRLKSARMGVDPAFRQAELDSIFSAQEKKRQDAQKEQDRKAREAMLHNRQLAGAAAMGLSAAGMSSFAGVAGGYAAGGLPGAIASGVSSAISKVEELQGASARLGSFSGDDRRQATVSLLQNIPIVGSIAKMIENITQVAMRNIEFASRTMQGVASFDPVAINRQFAELAGGVTKTLINAFLDLSDSVVSTARRLSAYDAGLAVGIARLDIRRMEMDMDRARRHGPDLLAAVERRRSFEERWGELMDRLLPNLLSILEKGMSFLESNADKISKFGDYLIAYLETMMPALDRAMAHMELSRHLMPMFTAATTGASETLRRIERRIPEPPPLAGAVFDLTRLETALRTAGVAPAPAPLATMVGGI